jgi:hypothetical protein
MIDVENVTGGSGDDTITGSAEANVLNGGAGKDTLSGGLGNDTLIGGDGDDLLKGEAGDDTFDEGAASNGADTMIGGAGVDTVNYSARNAILIINMDATAIASPPAGGPFATVGAAASGDGAEGDLIVTDVENCIGGLKGDTINGNASDNQLEGGGVVGTPDTIVDTINGLGGDDTIDGGGGADIIDCGDGEDLLLDLSFSSTSLPISCEL